MFEQFPAISAQLTHLTLQAFMLQERSKTLGLDSPAVITEKGVQSEEESFSLFFQ